jgi:hypothetical protein
MLEIVPLLFYLQCESTVTIRESALIRCYICVQKRKVVQVLLVEMVLAVNSTGTIKINTNCMKRLVLVLSIENSLTVTKIIIKQWLIMTYPLTGRDIPSKAMHLVAHSNPLVQRLLRGCW